MSLVEKRMDRRSFNKLLIAPMAAPILSAVACQEDPLEQERDRLEALKAQRAQPSQPQKLSSPRPAQKPAPEPKKISSPQSTQIDSRPPAESERAMLDREAKTLGLNQWLKLLSTLQERKTDNFGNEGEHRLDIQIINPKILKDKSPQTVGPEGYSRLVYSLEDQPLQVSWKRTHLLKGPWEKKFIGIKYVGEMQIAKIEVSGNSRGLSDIDRLNKLSWDGTVGIVFNLRYRGNYTAAHNSWSVNETAVRQWLLSPDSRALPQQFSPWDREGWDMKLRFENGQWKQQLREEQFGEELNLASNVLNIVTCGRPPQCNTIEIDPPK